MKRILWAVALMLVAAVPESKAIELDTGNPEKPFALGVRVGANCSNLSNNYTSSMYNVTSSDNQWKAGFMAGVVFDLNIKKYLVLQPGFFFETRANDYRLTMVDRDMPSVTDVNGSYSSTYFKIPLVMSFRLQFTPKVEWQVDFGPYFQFGLGGSEKFNVYSLSAPEKTDDAGFPYVEVNTVDGRYKRDYFGGDGFVRDYDWGFKMGTGMLLMEHYYVGIHYEAGCRNVMKPVEGSRRDVNGHNKAWDFTVGYVF